MPTLDRLTNSVQGAYSETKLEDTMVACRVLSRDVMCHLRGAVTDRKRVEAGA